MIITTLLGLVFLVISFILGLLGTIPGFPVATLNAAKDFIMMVVNDGAAMVFFFFRPVTFKLAIDVIFFIWAAEPIYRMVMWVLRKVPFLNIE